MYVSIFLGKLLGLYFSIYGLYLLINKEKVKIYFRGMLKPTAMFIGGLMGVGLGLALVLSHNIWWSFYQIVITIICWYILIKGLVALFFPEKMIQFGSRMIDTVHFHWVGWGCLIIGLYLWINSFIF